jgi:hypothetical protein
VSGDREGQIAVARIEFCQRIRGYSEDRWCAQWMRGVVDEIRKEGGVWLVHAARAQGWPIGLDGEDGWEPLTDDERDAVAAFLLSAVRDIEAAR